VELCRHILDTWTACKLRHVLGKITPDIFQVGKIYTILQKNQNELDKWKMKNRGPRGRTYLRKEASIATVGGGRLQIQPAAIGGRYQIGWEPFRRCS
jgi:hypothetical protein